MPSLQRSARGSPPRMRGEQRPASPVKGHMRITPAYAGRTGAHPFLCRCWWDHPRVCGENHRSHSSGRQPGGSPPRMRGELALSMCRMLIRGITPAYAGRTWAVRWGSRRRRDHPRVCGENGVAVWKLGAKMGSPPRMRGELIAQVDGHLDAGITPAYAGRTQKSSAALKTGKDHPRVCGENPFPGPPWPIVWGSPPRMRGERIRADAVQCGGGITPAYAGRTSAWACQMSARKDHPRVCGENGRCLCRCSGRCGSPPRMRGELLSWH
ncbi:Hypothetical protein PFR_JS2_1823 [Propionibacterium freudenreichii]|nr:Hypothetical protein PFR_JS2_1823 [Propionibacterium freudenreichii]